MDSKGAIIVLVCIAVLSLSYGCIDIDTESIVMDDNEKTNSSVQTGDFNIDSVTQRLPEKPETYELIKRNFYDSQIDDFTQLDIGVWKNPDFYPTWDRSGIISFTEHDYTRWGVHGYGFFPSEASWGVTNMQAGDELTFHTFLHTAWGVETWQGVKLAPVCNSELFDVTLSPNEFYLEPIYPFFYEEWTKMIEFKVVAKTDVPTGTYPITLKVESPSKELNEQWSWDVLNKFTDEKYESEINTCKINHEAEMCDKFVILRQNKYVSGSMFTPSNVYVSYITVS